MSPPHTRHVPDQNQLSVVTAVILLAYALGRLVELPAQQIEIEFVGVNFTFFVSGQVIILMLVAALISTGSDVLIRSHPKLVKRGPLRTIVHWIIPGTTALGLGLLLNTPQTSLVWGGVLLLSALFLVIVLVAEYTVIDTQDSAYTMASLGLSVLAYLIALVLFGWLKFIGSRASLAAGSTGFVATLLSFRLLALRKPVNIRMMLNSMVVGALVGQIMWVVSYWPVSPVGAGVLLLVVFYVAHGLVQQDIVYGLNRRVVIEYLLFGLFGLVFAGIFALSG